jgi:hypothetical protein
LAEIENFSLAKLNKVTFIESTTKDNLLEEIVLKKKELNKVIIEKKPVSKASQYTKEQMEILARRDAIDGTEEDFEMDYEIDEIDEIKEVAKPQALTKDLSSNSDIVKQITEALIAKKQAAQTDAANGIDLLQQIRAGITLKTVQVAKAEEKVETNPLFSNFDNFASLVDQKFADKATLIGDDDNLEDWA